MENLPDDTCKYSGVCASCGKDIDDHIYFYYVPLEFSEDKLCGYKKTLIECLATTNYRVRKTDYVEVALTEARRLFLGIPINFGHVPEINRRAKKILEKNKVAWEEEEARLTEENKYSMHSSEILMLVRDPRTGRTHTYDIGS